MPLTESLACKPLSTGKSKHISIVPLLVISALGIPLSLTQTLMSPEANMADVETAVTGAIPAESMKPVETRNVDLGAIAGVAFYTVEQDGYRLVVSLQALETGTPLRFVTTLAPEQRVTLTAPRRGGEPEVDVHFVRHGEGIDVKATRTAPRLEAHGD